MSHNVVFGWPNLASKFHIIVAEIWQIWVTWGRGKILYWSIVTKKYWNLCVGSDLVITSQAVLYAAMWCFVDRIFRQSSRESYWNLSILGHSWGRGKTLYRSIVTKKFRDLFVGSQLSIHIQNCFICCYVVFRWPNLASKFHRITEICWFWVMLG